MNFAPGEWWSKSKIFLREVRSEMTKVAWPSRGEVVSTTGVVLIAVVFFGVYLWLCDLAFLETIEFIFGAFGTGV
ncbi:MAG: preprotein translocase subunit SecE [Thermoanaerobaculia bacterium]|nr:preprotein translocase subunit SecE [Thermoanaerobaculia bacterium]